MSRAAHRVEHLGGLQRPCRGAGRSSLSCHRMDTRSTGMPQASTTSRSMDTWLSAYGRHSPKPPKLKVVAVSRRAALYAAPKPGALPRRPVLPPPW